jgi:hypothetical protein
MFGFRLYSTTYLGYRNRFKFFLNFRLEHLLHICTRFLGDAEYVNDVEDADGVDDAQCDEPSLVIFLCSCP